MLKRKIKWIPIFHSIEELDEFMEARSTKVLKQMFGEVLLVRLNGEVLAFKNRCPHQNKSLEGCSIQDGSVVCPWHQYAFSCETGRGHGMYLEKYPIKFEENGVFIGKEGWSLFG